MTYPLEDEQVTAFGEAMQQVIAGLPETERYKKSRTTFMDDLWMEFEYSIIDRMGEVVQGFVKDMAARVVTQILEGNEDQMKRYLTLDGYYTGRDRDHSVIHGTLFETGAIALRKKMAQAHADMIQNARILDLEDQVRSLVEQVNKKDNELEQVRDDLRNYSRAWD